MGNYHLPQFPIPQSQNINSADQYLYDLCMTGLKKRYSDLTPKLKSRLNYELDVIKKMGFA